MISKEYLYTAHALLRIAKSITDEAIANRLMALAADYERRARKADMVGTADALTLAADRTAPSPRLAKPN
jgi:hypothetical protein